MKSLKTLLFFSLFSALISAPAYADIVDKRGTYISGAQFLEVLVIGVVIIAVVIVIELIKKKK